MSSSWSLSSLRPRKLSWIGLNFSCSSYWVSNQALRRADSALTCSAVGATAAVVAVGASALRSQAARPRLIAMARARVLRRRAEVIGDPWKVAGSILEIGREHV